MLGIELVITNMAMAVADAEYERLCIDAACAVLMLDEFNSWFIAFLDAKRKQEKEATEERRH